MKASELRIRNLVKVNDLVVIVNRVEIDKFWATHNDLLFFQGVDTKPIPLTDKWFADFMFGEYRETNVSGLFEYSWLSSIGIAKNYQIHLTVTNGEYRIYKDLKLIACRRIQYVHQFQNWFFENTGYELTLNN